MKFRKSHGFTLIELMIVVGLSVFMIMLIAGFLLNTYRNNLSIQSITDMGNLSQQTVNRIRLDVSQNKRLLDDSVGGTTYFKSLEFPAGMSPLPGSKLPEIVSHGSLSPSKAEDFANPFVKNAIGNMLFYVQHVPAYESKEYKRIVDLYRFVIIYLREDPSARASRTKAGFLDVFTCISAPYADLFQAGDIADPGIRDSVVKQMKEAGIAALWDPQAEAEVAFTDLEGYIPGTPPLVQHRIRMGACHSMMGGLGRIERPAGSIVYTVAYNKTRDFPINRQVPLFATAIEGETTFPNGFEVAIVGPKSGRQVLVRLVLAANLGTQIVSRESTVISTVKDS